METAQSTEIPMTRAVLNRAAGNVLRLCARRVNNIRNEMTRANTPIKNILREVKNATKGIVSDINPEMLGRPLCIVLIGDDGFYVRNLPAFDGDDDILIECLNDVIEHLKERLHKNPPE
jgi:hypothetical protein